MTETGIHTFGRGGIHPETHKEGTSGRPIEPLPTPREVWLPLQQHLGEPAVPLVKKGEMVIRGQKIAEGGATGAPIHATISGKVRPIDRRPHPTAVIAETIIIQHDDTLDAELPFPEDPEWRTLPNETVLERIKEAGIVGLGGAAFPTWRKLSIPAGVAVDTLIINGAECEPYLTSDYRLMIEQPEAILEGSLLMARLIGVKTVKIGVETDKRRAIEALNNAARDLDTGGIAIAAEACQVRYPQGAERQLVTALTGRVIPPRALPTAVRVLVQNVATASAVHDAVRYRKPLLDRVVTVSGDGVGRPRNVRAPIGSLLSDLVEFCGGMDPEAMRLIAGGPMMGRALPRLDLPVIKGLNGLLVLKGESPFGHGYDPCISCGRCIDACPLGLEPDQVSIRVEAGKPLDTEPFGALDCYECGCCTYVCPAGRPLLQFMQVSKSAIRRAVETRLRR